MTELKMYSLCNLLTSCTRSGTKHSNRDVKVIMFITKNPHTVLLAGPVMLELQSGAIFTRKVK